jgi:hypothetical protein
LLQTDATATGDHDGFVVEGIVDIWQSGIGTRRGLVHLGGTLHVQSFVGTFVVEDVGKLIETGLLLQEVGGSRLGGLFFQGEVHALMATHSVEEHQA